MRKSYLVSDYEISMDSVDELGLFFEIEVKNRKFKDPKEEFNRLIEFVNEDLCINNYKIQKQGFIVLLWNPEFHF